MKKDICERGKSVTDTRQKMFTKDAVSSRTFFPEAFPKRMASTIPGQSPLRQRKDICCRLFALQMSKPKQSRGLDPCAGS